MGEGGSSLLKLYFYIKRNSIITLQLWQYCDVISLMKVDVTVCFVPQLEPSESASSSNLSLAKPRPNSELNGQSPSHLKVQRSVSSNHKQRRYSEQGEDTTCAFLCYFLKLNTISKSWQLELPCAFPSV